MTGNVLDSIYLSIRIDHLPADLGTPLGHSDREVYVPECDDCYYESVVCVELYKKVGNRNAQVDKHREDLESDRFEKVVDRISFPQS